MDNREQIEDAIVAILLRNSDALLKHEIIEQHFGKWKDVIIACKEVSAKGLDVDILSVTGHLGNKSLIKPLYELQKESIGAIANLPAYLGNLREIWRSQQIRIALTESINRLSSGTNVDKIISQLMQSAMATMVDEKKTYSYDAKAAMAMFIDRLETVFDARHSGNGDVGILTGISDIDAVLGGLQPSDMAIVGARPAVGKTSFGLSVMTNIAKRGKRVAMISSEMSAQQVMLRLSSIETGIPAFKLRDANLSDTDWPLLTALIQRLSEYNMRFYDKPSITIADVMLQSKAWMLDGGVDFILVDYLTRVKPIKSRGNQNLDIGDVVTGLKDVARTLNIPVMVLAQLNRDAANRRPVMSDLRDSGIIEQEADQILMLYRDYEDELATAEVIVEKNRHGESKLTVQCSFDKQTMRWSDIASYSDMGEI